MKKYITLNHSLDLISSKTYQKIYIFTPFPNEDTSFICNNLKTNNFSVEIIKFLFLSTIGWLKNKSVSPANVGFLKFNTQFMF